ncbi:hypothetical protein EMCG_01369 [[Emmonsia] crescens]|uniref:Protein kinase domain-containing protein n=1 Tax=[Emmonsia] crescens TaxID=73230 RepID=A0A0G2J9W3_9EURO|nr:hypothetical protein EMCG_01369 [Emmonsia crescens UAMH 3008]
MEFLHINVSEIVFKDQLEQRKFCVIFLVELRGGTCVMKVHHGREPKDPFVGPINLKPNIFVRESTAYRRFKESGICAKGITPDFYGTLENIDPKLCLPHLRHFAKDDHPPTAIFMEYIPNMKEVHWSNYTPERMQNFIQGIDEIHRALVHHGDIHPRNMMILEDDSARAIWIDFDRARTFNGKFDKRQQEWIDFEKLLVSEMAKDMKADSIEQKTNRCLQYYR